MSTELTQQLREWGVVQNRRLVRWERERVEHPMARAREFAPMTRERAAKELIRRDGRSRREMMGAAAGRVSNTGDVVPVPMWACDPIRCKESPILTPIEQPAAYVDIDPPDDLRWIDRAVSQLSRVNLVRAMCLREEFCGTGTQAIKAARVAEAYGGKLSVRQYRYELGLAMVWLQGRIAA